MSGRKPDYTLDLFVQNDDTLKHSQLYQLYNNFQNAKCEDGGTNDLCIESYYNDVHSSDIELYKKLQINLKKIYKSHLPFFRPTSKDIPKDKLCIYVKYWLYDEIIFNKIDNTRIAKVFNTWEKEKITECSECKCTLYNMKFEEIKHIKSFYDYFLLYDKNESNINNEIITNPYCQYFMDTYRMQSFKEIQCAEDRKNIPDCKEFIEYIHKYIKFDETLSSLSCKNEQRSADYFHHDDHDGRMQPQTKWKEEADEEQDLPVYKSAPVMAPSVGTPEEEENTAPVVASVTLMSVFIILFILYEFTPFRYMVQSGTRRFQRILKNLIGKSTKSESNFCEGEYENSDYAEYSIAYHSFQNS
ncbi:PIR Superfamily Protein [Plasmodium ovale curtisi]|uniref:PIR Superfamily Protein n=1 Tax=Plasmodium ovale curtisi TaxID=864141 RepID=A0A1A8WJB0_PLAOA|nr:PIR Superfamily Protein [Plasmodium ovale curtisi]